MPKTDDNHLHANNPPEHARFVIPIQYVGGRTAGTVFMNFVADIDYEVVTYTPIPVTASGAVSFDITIDGVTMLTTEPTATALVPVIEAVFSTTRISAGALVKALVAADSGASAGTGVGGLLVLRPLLGKERE